MKRIQGLFIVVRILLFVLLIFSSPSVAGAASDSIDIDLSVLGCNNNGVCESVLTEDFLTCPGDCYCDNDNICEDQTGEDFLSCSSDCYCDNDGICDVLNGETIGNCPADCTPVVPDTEATSTITGGGYRQLLIYDIETEIDLENQKVYISWKTNNSALSVVYWGKNQDYKIETLTGVNFTQEHFTSISNVPFGKYYFIIKARSFYGDTTFSEIGTFSVVEEVVDAPPDNPTNFRTFPTEEGIGLAWNNPKNKDFSRVRLVRETRGFPSTYLDGKIIYEGGGQSVIDYDVEDGQTYYYSLFAIDESGNPSTGVVMQVKYPLLDIYDQNDQEKGPFDFDDDFDTRVDDQITDSNYFPIERYKFTQDGQEIEIIDGILVVDGTKEIEISVDEKYIDPKNEVIVYFDINQSKNYFGYKFKHLTDEKIYRTIVPAFEVDNEIPFTIMIYSRIGEVLRKTNGIIASFLPKFDTSGFGQYYDEVIPSWVFWIIAGILIFWGLIWRKKRAKNKAQK